MHYRTLWSTNLKVSKICLGTMTRGHQNTERDAHNQLDYALEQGVNFIDTAEIYAIPPRPKTQGLTEQYIWTRLQKTWNRDKIILATKVTWAWERVAHIRNGEWFTSHGIQQAVEGSLKRLQTDYIDLYQLHRPQRTVPVRGRQNYADDMRDPNNRYEEHMLEILQTLQNLQQTGKIRHIWISNETPRGTMKYIQLAKTYNLPCIVSIQNAYSLLRREFEIGLAEICLQEKIACLPYSPLAGGILTGKYQNGAAPANARYTTRWKKRMPYYAKEKSYQAVDKYTTLAKELWISVTQLSLAWANDRNFVTSNIIWATSIAQLRENISSADISLSKNVYQRIDDIWREDKNPATF